MMRFLAGLVSLSLMLSGCTSNPSSDSELPSSCPGIDASEVTAPTAPEFEPGFDSLGDSDLLQYVEDAVHASLVEGLSSDDYRVDQVVASYVSKEYLEEVNYNSQENIYFGYKLSDIEAQYQGEKYVFSLNDAGRTEVRPFEAYDDTYDQVLKDVAIGAGVILVVVTVSVIASAVAAPATVSTVFAASATTGAKFALSSAALGGAASGIVEGFETGETDAALKATAMGASEGFKWGAISGVVAGGATKLLPIGRATTATLRTPRESEVAAAKKYGGSDQQSYIRGELVSRGTLGSTRPDLMRTHKGRSEAIEVKNYDLKANIKNLSVELRRQVSQRTIDLPDGTSQRVVLDVAGRGYSKKFLKEVQEYLLGELGPCFNDVLIDFME